MAKSLLITASTTLVLPARRNRIIGIELSSAAAASTLEIFDGTIGTAATIAIGVAGTGYTANDVLTLAAAGGGVQATVRVDTVGASGEITGVTLLTGGTGYVAATTYATTGGTGSSGTITVSTITDAGTSIAKLASVANESAPPVTTHRDCSEGVSARISGTSAKGYLIYE